jgi:hypothetical protein
MKNVLLLLFGLVLLNLPLSAEEGKKEEKEVISLEIMVIDALTEDPIPAAKIKIGQKEIEAYTDFDGMAEIQQLNQGLYDIEISFISYQKQQLSAFNVDKSSNKLLVKLQP